jgi:hypothetical protein
MGTAALLASAAAALYFLATGIKKPRNKDPKNAEKKPAQSEKSADQSVDSQQALTS